MSATDGKFQSLMLRAGGNRWRVSAIVAGSIFFVAALSLFLCIRRATGALTLPLARPQLVATALVMCLWALAVREFTAKRAAYFWISLCTMLLVAVGCSLPAARVVDWLVWLPAVGWIAMLPLITRLQLRWSRRRRLSATMTAANPEQILQQLTRFRTAEGKDAIRGTLAAEFQAGERQT